MITKEFKKAISQMHRCGDNKSVYNVLNLLALYTNEAGITLHDVREQIQCMLSEIEQLK